MTTKYTVLTSRSELAIYYGREYGINWANRLLKASKPVTHNKFLYPVKPLETTHYKLKRDANELCKRVSNIVIAFNARKHKKLTTISSLAHVIKE